MNNITVQDLCFSYTEDTPILKKLNLEIDGRKTAVVGQNGAGKTTFVKLLKGLLKPVSGKILINGTDISTTTVAELSKQVGMVFQNPDDQIFKNKIIEEVMFGPLNSFKDKEKARENAVRALEIVGLKDKMEESPYDFGLSERKLISIASVIAMENEIIILDEPTIAQDSWGKRRIGEIINRLGEEGKLVITIIHDMDFVANYFERVVVLRREEVYLDGPAQEVFAQREKIRDAYLELPHVAQLSTMENGRVYITVKDYVEAKRRG